LQLLSFASTFKPVNHAGTAVDAVRIVFIAVQGRVVAVGEKVVSIAGTGWGADSAIVMTASRFEDAVGMDPEKRMKIEEILAMPKHTLWAGYQ
jgi:hypothetical protein